MKRNILPAEEKQGAVTGVKLVVGYLGVVLMMIGVILLLPLALLIFYPAETSYAKCFIVPGVLSILVGYLGMFLIKGKPEGALSGRGSSVLVVCMWIITILVSAVPFLLYGGFTFAEAVFEMTSGYTTSGLTVCDVETLPKLFLFFRSVTHFFGGVGLILVMTSALSDRYGAGLYNAEGHPDKLVPNLVHSARMIFGMYAVFILVGTVLYTICGMSVFDAFNHSVAAVATGGFSTRKESIYYYLSDASGRYFGAGIEITTIVLMLLGQTNFFVNLLLIRGKFKKYALHGETVFTLAVIFLAVPIMAWVLAAGKVTGFWNGARVSLFQFVSAMSSTGYSSVESFSSYPSAWLGILLLCMLVGGGQGSTAGGIKQSRIILLLKSIFWNVRDRFSNPRTFRTNKIRRAGELVIVTEKEVSANYAFVGIYLSVLAVGTFLFMLGGFSFEQSLFEYASCLGNIGYSFGIAVKGASSAILWNATVGMFVGRLEIYIVVVAIAECVLKLTGKKVL